MRNVRRHNAVRALTVLAILSSTTVLWELGRGGEGGGGGGAVVHAYSIGGGASHTTRQILQGPGSKNDVVGVTMKESATPNKLPPMPWLPMTIMSSTILSIGLLLAPFPVYAATATTNSNAAAQISLDSLPPTSISIQIQDLPVVGNLLSGTYTKVPDGSIAKPSIVIKSPKDKIKAISSLATAGHLEFDINGSFLNTHLDVDVAADEAGKANVVVQSNLIPRLPFKNAASSQQQQQQPLSSGKASAWNVVTNMGNGESYYYNAKTGDTQFERPDKI